MCTNELKWFFDHISCNVTMTRGFSCWEFAADIFQFIYMYTSAGRSQCNSVLMLSEFNQACIYYFSSSVKWSVQNWCFSEVTSITVVHLTFPDIESGWKEDESCVPECITSKYIIKVTSSRDQIILKMDAFVEDPCGALMLRKWCFYICIASIRSMFLSSLPLVYLF